ncbi:cilia- and flagella-associated protein 20-like, partial [Sitophilus oryzae]|uniref:Cilia- and flagella-associated protein 20-like n=1 Tax=Sitophilus oryzae TaxID=7048 RepID=A0A6J2X5H8_SITOR
MRRRFRVSNFQSTTKVRPFCTTMPIGLSAGWNQVQFNLADFTKRAYGSVYMETTRVQIHANVRIRRIYFTDQLHTDDELPNEFKLFAPGPGTKGKEREERKSKEIAPEDVPAIKIEEKDEKKKS